MKAITLWPEWAFAVCALNKRVENRGWVPPMHEIGSEFMIHAGSHIGGQGGRGIEYRDCAMRLVCETAAENGWHYSQNDVCSYELQPSIPIYHPELKALVSPVVIFRDDMIPRGVFVASAKLERVTSPVKKELREEFEVCSSVPMWGAFGAVHWHLSNVRLVKNSPRIKGAQRLWTVPSHVAESLVFAE